MAENEKNLNAPEEEAEFVDLIDEDGTPHKFELIAEHEENGELYFAAIPAEDGDMDDEFCEYLILKQIKEGEEYYLAEIEDDAEFEKIAEIFDNLFDEEIDYDAKGNK